MPLVFEALVIALLSAAVAIAFGVWHELREARRRAAHLPPSPLIPPKKRTL